MADKHKWHDVIVAMANGLDVQYEHNGGWYKLNDKGVNPFAYPHWEWRIEPKTIMIGDMEVPEPIRENPGKGVGYYIVSLGRPEEPTHYVWDDDVIDNKMLTNGVLHETYEGAVLTARALVKLLSGKE